MPELRPGEVMVTRLPAGQQYRVAACSDGFDALVAWGEAAAAAVVTKARRLLQNRLAR